jgi:NADH:ubiquinone oxidoreductase subunit F (NADH-binding)
MRDIPFSGIRYALRCATARLIDVDTIDAYNRPDGYLAIARALKCRPEDVIRKKKSGLRGRGGGRVPHRRQWEAARAQTADPQIFGMQRRALRATPAPFMDRSIFEGDPHSVIEGMMIGAICHRRQSG